MSKKKLIIERSICIQTLEKPHTKSMGDKITGSLRLEDCVELCTPKSLFIIASCNDIFDEHGVLESNVLGYYFNETFVIALGGF